MVWIELLLCISAIVLAGSRLSKYGDEIAEKTGLGRSWIGLILLATVTSLPELISGISAVTLKLPDIAVGGVLGSCMFNLVILSLLDLAAGKTPLAAKVHHSHIMSAGFGIVLLAAVCTAKIFGDQVVLGWVSPFSLVYLVIYLLAMRTLFQFESKSVIKEAAEATSQALERGSLIKPCLLFFVCSVLIVLAALYLPDVADRIGKLTGLSSTFIGSSLVAITTSLPEVVVSLSAARLGAFDMAVGNVLGSNLFNVAILAVEDMFYFQGSLLAHSSMSHLVSALAAIVMSSIAAIGITFRAEKKLLALTWDSMAILVCYLAAAYWLFAHK
jgi:cation:H+ antiporter